MSPRKARRLPAGLPRRPRGGVRMQPGRNPGGPGGPEAGEPAIRLGPPQLESWPDGDWIVRQVPGLAAVKAYRCPGCDQEIRPGVAHVVAWLAREPEAGGRRHWHTACWRRRPRRPPR